MTTCSNCDIEIPTERSEGNSPETCSNCGSTDRTIHVSAVETLTLIGTASATVRNSAKSLLHKAQAMAEEREYNVAVVLGHMASELATEEALSHAFNRRGVSELEEPVTAMMNGFNLANDRIRNLYTALTNDDIAQESFWAGFKESAQRRNAVVHRGLVVQETDAWDSLRHIQFLIDHVGTARMD